MTHKTLDKIIEDLRKISDDFGSMVDENLTPVEAEPWIRIEDFDSDFKGMCWITYKRRTIMVYRVARRGSYFYEGLRTTGYYYMTECISHIIPIIRPNPPVET